LLKERDPQRFCLLVFRPMSLFKFNSLTTIDTFYCLGGVQVTHRTVVQLIVPQIFKLLPKPHIFFDLEIMFITNRKYASFCIF